MLTNILETNLPQGTDPLKLLQRALVGVWGVEGDTIFTGNLITTIQTSGIITNLSENPAIVLMVKADNTVKGFRLNKNDSVNEEYTISLILSTR